MSDYAVVGIDSLKVGAVNTTTYAMPTTFTTIVHLVPDSCKLLFESPEPNQILTEESDDVFIELQNATKKSFEFATYDAGNDMLLLAFGGSASGTNVWKGPTTATVTVERSLQMVSKTVNGKKHTYQIPHASIRAGGELKFGKKEPGQLNFSGSVLKAGAVAPIKRTLS